MILFFSSVFIVLLKLFGSMPIRGAIFVTGIPSSSIAIKKNAIELVPSYCEAISLVNFANENQAIRMFANTILEENFSYQSGSLVISLIYFINAHKYNELM
jgi:hypothetical protein